MNSTETCLLCTQECKPPALYCKDCLNDILFRTLQRDETQDYMFVSRVDKYLVMNRLHRGWTIQEAIFVRKGRARSTLNQL